MSKTSKKCCKGFYWSLGSLVASTVAAITGWIIYSRKYIRHDAEFVKAMDSDREDFQSENAGKLSYYADRSGEGVPLVLLHSINAAPSAFEVKPIFERFRGERPVFALELPGFGFSDRSDRLYSPQLFQYAVSDFLKEVVSEPADVVALSLSCEFAALAAEHSPNSFRSIVMISPTGFDQPKTDSISRHLDKRGTKNTLYAGLAVPLWNRPFYDLVASRPSIQFFLNKSFEGLVPARFVDYAYQTAHQPGAQYAPTYFLSGKLFTPAVRETVYKALELPVLVIYDRDPYTNFYMLSSLLKEKQNWQVERISPTKGLPHWEQPEKTFNAMETFWSKI